MALENEIGSWQEAGEFRKQSNALRSVSCFNCMPSSQKAILLTAAIKYFTGQDLCRAASQIVMYKKHKI